MRECFLVGAYCNTESRLKELRQCIINLNKFNLPIIISSHYTLPEDIIKDVDGFIYDPDNEILYQKDFNKYKSGFWCFYEDENIRIDKAFDFHHDYAFWTQIRNGFSLAKMKNYDMCYFIDFDVELDSETFLELKEGSKGYDSCSYPLMEYMNMVIFSCNPTIGLKVTESIPTFYDYFYNKPGQTNVEKVFYDLLVKNNAKINLIPKILVEKKNFSNFSSALNYFNNNYFIYNDKKIVAGIIPCCDSNGGLYLFMTIVNNEHNFNIYIEYNGDFIKYNNRLMYLGQVSDLMTINIYADGKLFYNKHIEDIETFKRMNVIKIK
jgi:hypothetical protein